MRRVPKGLLVVAVLALLLFVAPSAYACLSNATGNWSAATTWTFNGWTFYLAIFLLFATAILTVVFLIKRSVCFDKFFSSMLLKSLQRCAATQIYVWQRKLETAFKPSLLTKLPIVFLSSFLLVSVFTIQAQAQIYRASASAGVTTGVLTLTINKPTGTVNLDVMIAAITVRPSTATITAPTGWTLIRRTDQTLGNTSSQATYWKTAGTSEPTSYSWTFSTSTGAAGGISTFYNINTVNPVNVQSGQTTPSALSHAAPSVSTTEANTMVITTYSLASSATWTAPTGMIETVDRASDAVPAAGGTSIEMNYVTQPAAGATGTKTATASNDADYGITQVMALESSYVWTGAVSTNWATAGNWSTGVVPTSSVDAIIPSTVTQPTISTSVSCNDLIINSGAILTTSSTGTLNITGDITNSGTMTNSGTTNFSGTAAQQTFSGVTTFNNLTLNNTAGLLLGGSIIINGNLTITTGTLNTNSNNITLSGNLTNDGGFTAGTGRVTFTGSTSKTVTGSSTTAFNTITVNKGTNSNTIIDVQSVITMAAGGLTLTNGTFKLTSASTIVPFTADITASPYLIPGTAGLWCNGGTINTTTSMSWSVAGLLRISAGTLNQGSAIGNWLAPRAGANIVVEGGSFNIADRISQVAAIWTFTMTGGVMTLATVGNTTADRPPFNMDSAGSSFSMSGGTMIIERSGGSAGQNLGYYNIATGGTGFTGGTLQIGNASTPAGQTIKIETTIPIYDLTINSANVTAQLQTNGITVTNNLTISSGTLNANNLNITVGGNWTNNGGAFTAGTATVTFNSTTADQTIGGTAASQTFNNLTVDKSGRTLSVGGSTASLTLAGNLQLTNGTFNKGTGTTLNIAGNLVFNAGTTFQKGTGTTNFNGVAKTITDNTAALQDLGDVTVASLSSVALSTSAKMTTLGGAGTITLNANTLSLLGSSTVLSITTFNASTNSTTEFACAGNCEMPARAYHHLTINSAGNTVTLNGAFAGTVINGNLLVQAGTFARTGSSCGGFGCAVNIKGNITANAGAGLQGEIAQFTFAGTSQSVNLASPSTQDLGWMIIGTSSTNPTVTLLTDVYSAWGLTVGTTTTATGSLNLNGKTLTICCGNVLVNTGGTITQNDGTFRIDGGFGPRTITDNTGTQDFGNVIVGLTGSTVNLGSNIKAQAITVNGGTFGLEAYNLDVGTDSGTGSITGTGTLSASAASATVLRGTGNLGGGTFTFHSLQLLGNGTTTTLTGNVTVNDTLTFGNGTNTATFDLGGFTANRATAGGTLTVANGATLKIGGTNTIPSNYSTHSIGATSTIEYSGTNQSLAVLNSAQDYGNLTISGSGTKTLAGNVNVAGTLLFTSGTITTGSNTLNIKATGTVSRVSGHVIGNFKKNVATGATSKTFEIGDASNYTPVAVAFASVTTAGDLTASVVSGDHANIGTSTIIATKSVNRNWTLTNSGIVFTNYDATFTFVAGDVDGGANTSAFIVGKYSVGSWTYPTIGTKTATTTQATGLTAFSDFALGELTPLPPNVAHVGSVLPSGPQPPGTDLVYSTTFTNSGGQPAQLFIMVDPIPSYTDFKLGSATTVLGTTGLTVTVEFSNDNASTWTYTPVSGGGGALPGYDRTVTHVRWRFTGNLSQTSPNNTGSVSLTTRIQ